MTPGILTTKIIEAIIDNAKFGKIDLTTEGNEGKTGNQMFAN